MKNIINQNQWTKIIWLIPLVAITLTASRCKKNKNEPETELEKLPPITQTGVNTFGCLVNGVAWLPNGTKPSNGGPNIQVYVDPTFQGGKFTISGNKFNEIGINSVDLGAINCQGVGQFSFSQNNLSIIYIKSIPNSNCQIFNTDQGTYKIGYLNISKYDLASRIFSGTFEVTLYNPNTYTDTIKITNGRFDVKL
jgi:hypothetical protein